jgi:hypothetical protein
MRAVVALLPFGRSVGVPLTVEIMVPITRIMDVPMWEDTPGVLYILSAVVRGSSKLRYFGVALFVALQRVQEP